MFTEADKDAVLRFASRRSGSQIGAIGDPRIQRLSKLDWDLRGAKTDTFTHRLHPYPAKFIPQIPNAIIQELSSVGDTVLDPFCGSGTTLVEALLLKRHAVGMDASPLACLISSGKTVSLSTHGVHELHTLARRASELGGSLGVPTGDGLLFDLPPFTSEAARPDDDSLEFWFLPHVIEELAELRAWCQEVPCESARTLALTALSSIIVAVSKQDSDTRYVRREKDMPPGEAMRRFARALERALVGAAEFDDLVEDRFRCQVIQADVTEPCTIGQVDLVVCSPPYPNAYSYHLYHRTRMVWLGMNQPLFKEQEIGSHRKYSRKGPQAATEATFESEMSSMFGWLKASLKRTGFACFVVGDSTVKGVRINNADLLVRAAAPHGFIEVGRLSRRMQASRKSFNPTIGRIKEEQILILQNENSGNAS